MGPRCRKVSFLAIDEDSQGEVKSSQGITRSYFNGFARNSVLLNEAQEQNLNDRINNIGKSAAHYKHEKKGSTIPDINRPKLHLERPKPSYL